MRPLRDLATNLRLGFLLCVLKASDWRRFRIGPDQFVLLSLLYIAECMILGLVTTDDSRSFNVHGLSYVGSIQFISLLVLMVIAWIQDARWAALPLLFMQFSAFLIVTAIFVGINYLFWTDGFVEEVQLYYTIYGLVMIWSFAINFVCLKNVFKAAFLRTTILTSAMMGIVVFAQYALPREPLWYGENFDWNSVSIWDEEEEEKFVPPQGWAPYRAVNTEAVYYSQPDLMEREIASLLPQRPDLVDLYFVGFAGYAYEDVFLKEVRSVRSLFDKRFDTGGRSLALINNLQALEDTPLASKSNLRDALSALGNLMDPDQDILFLFLTSHGSHDHRLAVSFWPLNLRDLTPSELRQMLDESGILWRVIVVSACYSGGFIDPLRSETTVILTAARHDRTSFGCSNERDFTYFGDAYFNQELRKSYSFIDAFFSATETVGNWEEAQDIPRSLPQIDYGRAIDERLRTLERRLQSMGLSASISGAMDPYTR